MVTTEGAEGGIVQDLARVAVAVEVEEGVEAEAEAEVEGGPTHGDRAGRGAGPGLCGGLQALGEGRRQITPPNLGIV